MKNKNIEDAVTIIDITTDEDDPYYDWEIDPAVKFIEELRNEGFAEDEIYYIDIDEESGIIIDYDLYPHEIMKWDYKEKNMKLRIKYPPLRKYLKALKDLGINYDKEYWEGKH